MTIAFATPRHAEPASPALPDPPDPLAVLRSVGGAVYDWDLLTDGLQWSPNAATLLGVEDGEGLATGRGFHAMTAGASAFSRRDAVLGGGRSDAGSGVAYQIRYGLRSADGRRVVWVDDTGRWFAGADGRPARAHGLVRIASARGAADEDAPPADIDPLTGCRSRARLLRTLGSMLEPGRTRQGFGLLLIGIDDLPALNRAHGYDAVDEMLAGVAAALRAQIRSADCVARYSGNKFALMLANCDPAQIAPAAARTLDILSSARLETSAGCLPARARIGGVLGPRHGRSVHALLLNAETALDGATQGARFNLYDPTAVADEDRLRAGDLAAEIVAALNEGRVRLALQPIVAARSGECVMSEALLRIVQSDGQVLEPAMVLPAAATARLMPLLDQRVLDLAVAHLRDHPGTVSLNVSAETLGDPDWPARVAAVVRLNPGVASRLVVELSEEAVGLDPVASASALAEISRLGLRIAVDHFGAGHASLRILRTLQPDFLKIDGAFVQNLMRSPDDRFLVRSLIAVARQIGAPVIAEWVENAGTAATLTEWGASYLQGAHFGGAELARDSSVDRRPEARAG